MSIECDSLSAAADTKRAINVQLTTMGKPAEFDQVEEPISRRTPKIRPDQYFRYVLPAQHMNTRGQRDQQPP